MEEKIKQLILKHGDEINAQIYEPVILDIYSQCGSKGVAYFKSMLVDVPIVDMNNYDKAILNIIKGLLDAK